MGDNMNEKKQELAQAPAQQGNVMDSIQEMIESSLKNAIDRMQRIDIKKQMGDSSPDDADDSEAMQVQMDIDEIKLMVGTLQKFVDNLNMMIAQLEGKDNSYGKDEEKFLDDYMATADSILEIAAFSTKDRHTGLSNRYGFDSRMILEWNRALRHESPLSLLIFGVVVSGYNEGALELKMRDEMLRSISKALENSIKRSTDFIARWSDDDEFVALLPITDKDGAMIVAERIRAEIGNMDVPSISEKGGKMTVYIGLNIQTPKQENQLADYVDGACNALNSAKEAGDGRIVLIES